MKNFFKIFSLVVASLFLACCEPDEEQIEPITKTEKVSNKPKVTKPSFDKYLTTTDKDGFSIRVRFKTGGDQEGNISATVHWKAYSKKPSSTPSKDELTKVESMRKYGTATYHNTGSKKGMTESIVFDKTHAGYGGGTYIYYYVECKNSVGTAASSISYTIVPR